MDFTFTKEIPEYILRFLQEWKRYSVEGKQETRTISQNSILWGYYYKEAIHAFSLKGIIITNDQAHFFFRTLIPKKKKKCPITKKYRTEERSTTKLSKKQFNFYIEAIKNWVWHNLEYSIKEPTDEEQLAYYDTIF